MISLLEAKGYNGTIILIDGSPAYITSSLKKQFIHDTDAQFQTAIFSKIATFVIPLDALSQYEVTGNLVNSIYITTVRMRFF